MRLKQVCQRATLPPPTITTRGRSGAELAGNWRIAPSAWTIASALAPGVVYRIRRLRCDFYYDAALRMPNACGFLEIIGVTDPIRRAAAASTDRSAVSTTADARA